MGLIPGSGYPLEEGKATQASVLAWGIPRPVLGAAESRQESAPVKIPTLTTRWSEIVKQKQQPISVCSVSMAGQNEPYLRITFLKEMRFSFILKIT